MNTAPIDPLTNYVSFPYGTGVIVCFEIRKLFEGDHRMGSAPADFLDYEALDRADPFAVCTLCGCIFNALALDA